jgi:hypothetical protein
VIFAGWIQRLKDREDLPREIERMIPWGLASGGDMVAAGTKKSMLLRDRTKRP